MIGKPRMDVKPNLPTMDASKGGSFLGGIPNLNYSSSATSIDSTTSTLVNSTSTSPPELSPVEKSILARQESAARLDDLRRSREAVMQAEAAATQPYLTSINTAGSDIDPRSGLRVFSNGQVMPAHMQSTAVQKSMAAAAAAADANANAQAQAQQEQQQQPLPPPGWPGTFDTTQTQDETASSSYAPGPSAGPSILPIPLDSSMFDSPGGGRFRFRSSKATFTPGWAIPPRVLLVDDDSVSRKLFSKFLQVSGCTIDVAVDGIGAVNKMNLEKYDLVLMVRFFFRYALAHELTRLFDCRIS